MGHPGWLRASAIPLASLSSAGDRFNIVLFNQAMTFFNRDGVVPANPPNIGSAEDFLSQVHAGGTTDINSAMGRLLVRDVSQERVYDIIFISDGKPTEGVQNMPRAAQPRHPR